MKKISYILFAGLMFSLISCETESSSVENETLSEITENEEKEAEPIIINGMAFYGLEQFELAEGATVDSVYNSVINTGTYKGVLKGELIEVCQKAGCWSKLKRNDGSEMMVFYKDHFGIPTDTKTGIEVIMYGIGKVDTLTVDFQKHLLDDAAESGEKVSQEEYDAIKGDKFDVSFEASGVLIPIEE